MVRCLVFAWGVALMRVPGVLAVVNQRLRAGCPQAASPVGWLLFQLGLLLLPSTVLLASLLLFPALILGSLRRRRPLRLRSLLRVMLRLLRLRSILRVVLRLLRLRSLLRVLLRLLTLLLSCLSIKPTGTPIATGMPSLSASLFCT